jgi:ABC-type bacteriocin/lantibiotic exporter with double-glycine peptidase domain
VTLVSHLPAFFILAYVCWSGGVISAVTAESRAAQGSMNRFAGTLLDLFPIIRLYDGFLIVWGGYNEALSEWERKTVRLERVKAVMMSCSGLLSCVPMVILFYFGGRQVIGGTMAIGTLYIFVNLSGNTTGVFMNMPGHIAAYRQFTANLKRLEGILR